MTPGAEALRRGLFFVKMPENSLQIPVVWR
jgi:hypothetical protein